MLRILVNRHASRAIQAIVTSHEQWLGGSLIWAGDGIGRRIIDCVVWPGEAARGEEEDVFVSGLDEGWPLDGTFVWCSAIV